MGIAMMDAGGRDTEGAVDHLADGEGLVLALLEAIPAQVALLDRGGRILAVNAAWRRFWLESLEPGTPAAADAHLGLDYLEICRNRLDADGLQVDTALAGISAVIAGDRRSFTAEYACRGKERGFLFRLEVSRLGRAGSLAIHWDVTDARRQAESLRAGEERYRAVVEDQTEVISRFDSEGVFSFVNEVYCRFFGKRAEELIGKRWYPVAHPEDVDAIESALATLSPQNPVVCIENRVFQASGETRWMQFVNRAFFDADGCVREIQSVGRDITERKLAEQALRHGEARYHTLVEALAEGVLVYGPDGHILLCNPAAARILGLRRDELLGAAQSGPGWTPMDEDMRPIALADLPVSRSLRNGVAVHGAVIALRRPDASLVWLTINSAPLPRNEGGAPSGVLVTLADISATKRAEQALRESEARYRALVETAPDAIIVNHGNRVVLANQAALRLFGAETPEDLLGRRVLDLFPSDCHGLARLLNGKMYAPGLPAPIIEDRILRLTGGVVEVEITSSPVSFEGARALHIVLRDISRRKRREAVIQRFVRAERALGHAARALRGAEDEPNYLDQICRILVEDCGHAMVWVGMAEPTGEIRPVVHAGFDAGYLDQLSISWRDDERGRGPAGQSVRTARSVYCRDVETDPLFAPWKLAALARGFNAVAALPLVDETGRAFGVIALYTRERDPFTEDEEQLLDLLALEVAAGVRTLRLRAEHARTSAAMAALREEMQSLVEWQVAAQTAAGIAHEMNQPLNAITVFGEAALRCLAAIEQPAEKLGMAVKGMVGQAERAGDILRELMVFFRNAEAPRECLDLGALAREAVNLARSVGLTGAPVTIHASPRLRPVSANRLHIEKVLINLIRNGMEAMAGVQRAGHGIAIHLEDDGERARVVVRDTGAGLDGVTASRVFDPFFTTKTKGIGMGLTICRALVEAQGGKLWVESEPGQGATFQFTLPYAP